MLQVNIREEAVRYLSTRLMPNHCRVDDPTRSQYFVQRKNKVDTTNDVLQKLLIPHIPVRLRDSHLCNASRWFPFLLVHVLHTFIVWPLIGAPPPLLPVPLYEYIGGWVCGVRRNEKFLYL